MKCNGMDTHHIYEKNFVGSKSKGYPDWIHSPINTIDIEHWHHINKIDRKNTSKAGMEAKVELYQKLRHRTQWLYINGLILVEESIVIEQVYYWCLVQNFSKAFKNYDLLKMYQRICEKYSGSVEADTVKHNIERWGQ